MRAQGGVVEVGKYNERQCKKNKEKTNRRDDHKEISYITNLRGCTTHHCHMEWLHHTPLSYVVISECQLLHNTFRTKYIEIYICIYMCVYLCVCVCELDVFISYYFLRRDQPRPH